MSKIKQFIKNISPLNNRTEMPIILYIIKVIIIFWFVKFGAEIIGEGIVIAICFTCGKNPLRGEMFSANIMMLMMYIVNEYAAADTLALLLENGGNLDTEVDGLTVFDEFDCCNIRRDRLDEPQCV